MFSTKFNQIIFIILFVFNISLAAYYINQKEGWHMDEQWSYGHANSTKGAYLADNIDSFFYASGSNIHDKWLNGKVFHDYLTTQNDEQFRYAHIWKNLKTVEHPPLFFVLLHTICSFTPDIFSPWQAGSLNLLAFALTLIVLYKLARIYLKDDIAAMLPVFWWGFSSAGLATVLFMRMYMLQTLFAVCLIYQASRMINEETSSKKRLFLIFLFSALGMITHYSSVFFSFFVTGTYELFLLFQKRWKTALLFPVIMLISVGVLFILFPSAWDVLQNSFRAKEATKKALNIYNYKYGYGIWTILYYGFLRNCTYDIYFKELFGFENVRNIVLFCIFVGFYVLVKLRKIEYNKTMLGIIVTVVLMTMYLCCLMPDMRILQLRYYMLCIPLATVIFTDFILTCVYALKIRSREVVFICAILVFLHGFVADFKHNVFRFSITSDTQKLNKEFQKKNIAVVASVVNMWDLIDILKDTKSTYLTSYSMLEKFPTPDYLLAYNSLATEYYSDKDKKMCFYCIPRRAFKFDELRNDLEYIGPYRNGIVNFDVYKGKRLIKNF